MSRHSSTQVYNEFTKVPIKIHVAMSTKTRQFSKYLYVLFIYCLILFFQKFYFVVEPERPIATVSLVRPGWTIC